VVLLIDCLLVVMHVDRSGVVERVGGSDLSSGGHHVVTLSV